MSNLSQFLGSAGKGNPLYNEFLFVSSKTWVTPVKGKYLVTAIGGGGSGAYSASVFGGSGGAGGLAQSLWDLPAGFSLVLSIGAGGAPTTTMNSNGNSGGTTTVSGSGLTTLTANGGSAGIQTSAGSAGGTASGGNIMNVTGGTGVKGGGAVGVYGVGYSGNSTDLAGAGVGGPPSTDGSHYPGTAFFSGDEIKADNMLFLESYLNPVNVLGGTLLSGFINGRFMSPNGGLGLATNAAGGKSAAGPGCGASYLVTGMTPADAGLFAGGAATWPPGAQKGHGGAFGGGGGGILYGATGGSSGKGGCGGVVIEYIYTP